jgi:ABC-2 type transport system ATP-binding protein
MITVNKLTKRFGSFTALDELSLTIESGCVYGLVGSNGAGKSTLLRLISGIYNTDGGSVEINGQKIYDNPEAKKMLAFVPDELFFLPQATMNRMAELYASSYDKFDRKRYGELVSAFGLNPKAKINTFSKGMKRQAATILALSCKTEYVFLDETFDGLDPVMRNLVKKVIYSDVADRGMTAVITSHSLRELEDTCDKLALLHKGGIVFESDIENIQTMLFKVQVAFADSYDESRFDGIEILNFIKKGSVTNMIVRGDRTEVEDQIAVMNPILCEILPLSLEEVFIYELEARGYAFDDIFLKENVEEEGQK